MLELILLLIHWLLLLKVYELWYNAWGYEILLVRSLLKLLVISSVLLLLWKLLILIYNHLLIKWLRKDFSVSLIVLNKRLRYLILIKIFITTYDILCYVLISLFGYWIYLLLRRQLSLIMLWNKRYIDFVCLDDTIL